LNAPIGSRKDGKKGKKEREKKINWLFFLHDRVYMKKRGERVAKRFQLGKGGEGRKL